jgi:parallel beta-helix repeat protein
MREQTMRGTLIAMAALGLALAATADAKTWRIKPGPDAQGKLQAALIQAKPGDEIRLAKGRFDLTAGLSLDVDRVRIRGEGQDRSILSFKGQKQGAEGLLITSDRVVLENFAVEDSKGDAIKSKGSDQITFRNLRVEWTGGPKETNGAYGVYPVTSTNVLIERVTVRGASDAGIYVGQSKNIIVRDNLAEFNVAGIEIENSEKADVYRNVARRNTGGILVFDLPGLPIVGGNSIRVFENTVQQNDTPNFAPKGNIVATVPTGTGMIVMANRNVHVFKNTIGNHGTTNIMVIAYREKIEDRNYNALPRDIVIRDNVFGAVGFKPAGDFAALAGAGLALPDILWDGATTYVAAGQPRTEPVRIDIRNNIRADKTAITTLSLGVAIAGGPLETMNPTPSIPPVTPIAEPPAIKLTQQ